MDIEEVKKMSTPERLQAMELLWDSILCENGKVDTPEWHEDIIRGKKGKIAELESSRGNDNKI